MNSPTPNVQDPDLCVTGLGSLGLPLPQGALRLIEQYCPECPHWPQLPVRSPQERALSQFTAGWGVLKPGGGSGELWTWPEEVPAEALDEEPAPVVWAWQTIFHLLLNLMRQWSGDLEEVGMLLRQTLVTPSSGLGQLGPEACELQLQLCDLLAFMLRDGFQKFTSGEAGGFEI